MVKYPQTKKAQQKKRKGKTGSRYSPNLDTTRISGRRLKKKG